MSSDGLVTHVTGPHIIGVMRAHTSYIGPSVTRVTGAVYRSAFGPVTRCVPRTYEAEHHRTQAEGWLSRWHAGTYDTRTESESGSEMAPETTPSKAWNPAPEHRHCAQFLAQFHQTSSNDAEERRFDRPQTGITSWKV